MMFLVQLGAIPAMCDLLDCKETQVQWHLIMVMNLPCPFNVIFDANFSLLSDCDGFA